MTESESDHIKFFSVFCSNGCYCHSEKYHYFSDLIQTLGVLSVTNSKGK